MPNTFHPTQIGYTPSGQAQQSILVLGKNVSASWQSIGFGPNGQPDIVEKIYINLTKTADPTTTIGTITLNVADLQSIIAGNSHATSAALTFGLREVDVCDNGTAKKMIILASATYLP